MTDRFKISTGIGQNETEHERSRKETWLDPVLIARSKGNFGGSKFTYLLRANIGGFGKGSDFAWPHNRPLMLVLCSGVQCLVVSFLVRILSRLQARLVNNPGLWGMTTLLTGVMLIMIVGNMAQVTLWSTVFMMLGEFDDFETAFYFSVVNFTTLGYGDIAMSKPNRLLGALEAGNGILMLGLTTSVLFLVLYTYTQRTGMWKS